MRSKPLGQMLQFIPTISFLRIFFTNNVMCCEHYDVIYHPSPINSQYLKTGGGGLTALVLECLEHFKGIVPSVSCILAKQHGICVWKRLSKSPGNTISETLIFKMSPDASALESLCLWCKFQSCVLFIIGLLLKNFLTALHINSVFRKEKAL